LRLESLKVPARAKLNLDLEVIGRRPDGYHDIRSTFQAVELHDALELEPASINSFASDGFDVNPSDNSVLQAHQRLEHRMGRALPVRMRLHKRIPPGSGMGGASSDAAAALVGLKQLFKLDVNLEPIAAEVGSDVPFFLHGGTARVEGRGERITPLPDHHGWFAIAWPAIELATPAVYRAWDEMKGEGPNHLRRAAERVDPRVAEFAEKLGPGWQMTGSGSAFFLGVRTEKAGRQAVERLDCWTAVTRAVGRHT
jgi:4-diphosphocytidyl-2-C-methyl-D-erythritol kinase